MFELEGLKKLKGFTNNISDHFIDTYKDLFNKTRTSEPMLNLLREVTKILKDIIKLGKNDPELA